MSKIDTKREQIWNYLRDHPATASNDVSSALGADEASTRTLLWSMFNRGMVSRQADQKPEPNSMGGAVKFYRYSAIGTAYEFKRKPTLKPLPPKPKNKVPRGPYKKRMEQVQAGVQAATNITPMPTVGSWLDDDTKVTQFLADLQVRQLLRLRRVLTRMMDGPAREAA